MKILYYSTPSFADCDFPLIKSLQGNGNDVTYLIRLAPYSLKSTLFNIKEQIPKQGIFRATEYKELSVYKNYMDMANVYIINQVNKSDSSFENLKLFRDVYSFIIKGKFDVVHTDGFFSFYECINFFSNKNIIQTIHDPFPHTGENSLRKKIWTKLALRFAKRFVLLNSKQLDDFSDFYKIPKSRIDINALGIYDCINAFKIKTSNDKFKNILFFGRISPYKGIEYLLEAMKKVHEVLPDVTLTIAGGGKLYFDYTPYDSLDYVTLINRYVGMEELAQLLYDSSVVVCPYTDATQSGVIMTAFSMCKPVIATTVGGLSEMIQDGENGMLVSPKNTEELADAIIKYFKEHKEVVFAENIKNNYFTGNRSWKYIADKYIQCYTKIVSD